MGLSALNKKLIRDLAHIWGQALAIALVMAAGVATLVLSTGAYRSLEETRAAYYERYRFADVFATARRAPRTLLPDIASIKGVAAVEARIRSAALLDVPGLDQPATGLVVSLPEYGPPRLNQLYVREGRLPDPARDDEIAVNEAFALAHGFRPGSQLSAILNGKKRALTIVGIALSPEFVYALGPGDLVPDDRRFGVLWMGLRAAEAAFDQDGAFNDLAIGLLRGASAESVIDALDQALAAYGGQGAHGRKDQQSHAFLEAELSQLEAMARIVPPIFLAVAAFLINMTLARLIAMEREQIGLLKALGYRERAIGLHYMMFVTVIAVGGIIIGSAAGVWLGRGLTELYGDFFHFPFLVFIHSVDTFLIAAGVSLLAAWVGGFRAVQSAVRLSPAVAMAPPVPVRYSRGILSRLGLSRVFSQSTMMILRHLVRYPVRAGMTILGVSASCALLVMSLSSQDSVETMIDLTYFQSSRQDVSVIFTELRPEVAAAELARLPGVLRAEPTRHVSVTMRHGSRHRRVAVQGIAADDDLTQLLDQNVKPVTVPDLGVALSEKLAGILGARLGDRVVLEVMEGKRRVLEVPVTGLLQGYLGLTAFMQRDALNALTGDGHVISSSHLAVDSAHRSALYTQLKAMPAVSAVVLLTDSLAKFRATLAQNMNTMMTVYVVLSSIVTFGVVYNSARIQLSENGRELASLRVLGFTRGEVSAILLGEIAILVAIAIPLGWVLGYGFTWLLISGFDTELYRVPFVIERATFGYAGLIVAGSAAVTALLVRRRIDQLDLIAVLKTRE